VSKVSAVRAKSVLERPARGLAIPARRITVTQMGDSANLNETALGG
jgi:hypothetical protein